MRFMDEPTDSEPFRLYECSERRCEAWFITCGGLRGHGSKHTTRCPPT